MSAFTEWLFDHLEGATAVTLGAGSVVAMLGRRIHAALRARREAERAEILVAIGDVASRIDAHEARNDDRHRRVTGRLEDLAQDVKRVNSRTHRLVSSVAHIKGRLGLPNGDHLEPPEE